MTPTVTWIGLGKIARHHLTAFVHLPELGKPTAGCDINPLAREEFEGRLAVYDSLEEMLDRTGPDIVIVSTPTPTHAEICQRVIRHGGMRTVLVEKPIATTVSEVAELIDEAASAGVELRGIYHAAYAPEVEWALANLREEIAAARAVESEFLDPYSRVDGGEATAVYGDSWLDSGINALSIVTRLVSVEGGSVVPVTSLDQSFVGTFSSRGDGGQELKIRIFTSWRATEPSKVTRLYLDDGGLLVLNHQSTAAHYFPSGDSVLAWGSTSPLPRLTQHYAGALRHALLATPSSDLDLRLHALLLESRT